MAHSSLGLSRRRWAAIFLGAGALTIAACSGLGTGPWLGTGASSAHASHARPLTQPTATFIFSTLNPQSYPKYEVTAVNDEDEIAGVYQISSGAYKSFRAQCTYITIPPTYVDCSNAAPSTVTYPGAAGTYFNANDNTDPWSYDAGYISSPNPGVGCTTCGVLYDKRNGLWPNSPLKHPLEGSNSCAVTKLLGINGAKVAVGYYEKNGTGGTCTKHAFEEYLSNNNPVFYDFKVPGASSSDTTATGIDNSGGVVGTAIVGGVQEGWYYNEFKYYVFYVDQETTSYTQPTGINWPGGIVGNYQDSSGKHHGFLAFTSSHELATPVPRYAVIDDGTYGTYVNSITTSYWIISGWSQTDSNPADVEGFVGTCKVGCPGTPDPTSRLRAKPRTGPTRPAKSRPAGSRP
jgi:hypothetical protein